MIIKKMSVAILTMAVITAITSCGPKSETAKEGTVLTPKSTEIKGDLGEYYEVVNKDYPLTQENGTTIISVEVKRKSTDFKFPATMAVPFGAGTGNYHVGFGIELFDDAGPKGIKNAIDTGKLGVYNTSDVASLINLKQGETGYIRWAIESPEGLKTFQLTSALEGSTPTTASPVVKGNSAPAKEVINWDKVLDDYEALVNQYISLSKKAKNKDISALAELPLVLGQANTTGNKIKAAKGELSPAQWSRFITIQTKLVQASVK